MSISDILTGQVKTMDYEIVLHTMQPNMSVSHSIAMHTMPCCYSKPFLCLRNSVTATNSLKTHLCSQLFTTLLQLFLLLYQQPSVGIDQNLQPRPE